ncbi:MAG: TOMM precursor leader peptide-binding protein [Myxococcota bacterium]
MPPRRPTLSDEFVVEGPLDGALFVVGDGRALRFSGPLHHALIPLLDGTYTEGALVTALVARGFDAAAVHYALRRLRRQGVCIDAEAPPSVQMVRLHAIGDVDVSPLRAVLPVSDDGLCVVAVDDYRRAALAAVNADALQRSQPWCLVRLRGRRPWVGPLFVPGETACWACLNERLAWNPRHEAFLRERIGRPDALWPAKPASPALAQTAAGVLALALRRWREDKICEVIEVNGENIDLIRHPVLRRPQCAQCGEPDLMARQQRRLPVLTPQPSGWRQQTPEQVLKRLGVHVSRISGIVEDLRPLPEGATPVVYAGRPRARRGATRSGMPAMFRSANLGKGSTLEIAKVSALCEALERYAAVFQGDEALETSRLKCLSRRALVPDQLQHFSERQRADRERWNRLYDNVAHQIPEPFDPDVPIQWTPAWSLMTGERIWMPAALCYLRYPDTRFGLADSNGVAAGSTLADAILQGLLELIERDAVAVWWYNRIRRPAVSVELAEEHGRQTWALDLRHDLGVPVAAAISCAPDGSGIMYGFGAHLDPQQAVQRAVAEMSQLAPIRARFQQRTLDRESAAWRWFATETLQTSPYLCPEGQRGLSPGPVADVIEGIEHLKRALSRVGLEAFVVDLSRPDVALRVVRVVVPGLRHFWPRFGPGRLFSVPVEMGWCAAPLAEGALNPVPILF